MKSPIFISGNYMPIPKPNEALNYLKEIKPAMLEHNLKEIHFQYDPEDEEFWSQVISDLHSQYNINASADDDRYWKDLGGISWGYEPIEL
ncbi:hypothetical protein HK099_001046 [Clydaea vesicula]|uniref:Uncharacterized protein n=1 Tax=Clydaea vesicula TaxID=447962 RepID=A0AAD5XV74_9FUNG|nr:hypothetical protein HK099_001046 [Clydaea vesicula]